MKSKSSVMFDDRPEPKRGGHLFLSDKGFGGLTNLGICGIIFHVDIMVVLYYDELYPA